QPFLDSDLHCFFLARTSNPGAEEMQDVEVVKGKDAHGRVTETEKYWEFVTGLVANHWNQAKNCGLVFGATYPEEAAQGRLIVGDDMPFLVPGIGKQGGDIKAAAKAARNSHRTGAIFNVSSDLIYADDCRQKALEYTENLYHAMRV
ncbi:MAG TPA: orotidine 5'-phosphate decarboxylase, partial [Candidatus Magasanikbacteria bacterium]|nr:orotidine 5'-phosphate decarboxylase [Candidatus Magasanikbacteria bacterium]